MDEVTRILIFSVIFTLSAVILLLISFAISRRRQVQHKKQLLEQQYKTREDALLQVSRDLHDDVGSSLSGINLLTQLAMQQPPANSETTTALLQKINTYTNEVIEKVSDMAWLIKPSHESLTMLIDKLKAFSLGMASAKNISMHFNYDFGKPAKELSIQERKAIYLICKEAINNAIKYAACKNIYCTFHLDSIPLQISISDDGVGFKMMDIRGGNGLANMKIRAKEINAKIDFSSEQEKGTVISLVLYNPPN